MTVLHLTNFNIRDLELNPNVFVLYLENEKRKGGDRLCISLRDHHRSLGVVVKKSGGVDEESYYTNREFEWVRESLEKTSILSLMFLTIDMMLSYLWKYLQRITG